MTTYFDISHLEAWSGRLSGIERVEYNLMRYYRQQKSSRFMTWSAKQKAFVAVNRQHIDNLIGSIEATQVEIAQNGQLTATSRSLIDKIRTRIANKLQTDTRSLIKAKKTDRIIIPCGLWDKQDYITGVVELAKTSKMAHIIFDMIPIVQPALVLEFMTDCFGEYVRDVLPYCEHVLTISENTAQDTRQVLADWETSPLPRISPFTLGSDLLDQTADAQKPQAATSSEYILAVGTLEIRKNYPLLAYTYQLANERSIQLPTLYLAGRVGWLADELVYRLKRDPYLSQKIITIDNPSDAELLWLYQNALFTVCPSFYEGWGLPVAESLAYGKPCLSSNTSSLPEAGGKLADYFSPNSPEELLAWLQKYSDPKTLARKTRQVQDDYQQTTWQACAQQFDKLLRLRPKS